MNDLCIWWSHLEPGEKASWVQAWGAIAAIAITAVLAGYGEFSRRRAERRQAIIFYKIACDTFGDVVSILETADRLADDKSGRDAILYLRAAVEHRMIGNIDILQQTMMTPLPNSKAAKDVQFSRTFTYVILDKLKDIVRWTNSPEAEEVHRALQDILVAGKFHRDVPRTDSGPWEPSWWRFWERAP